MLVELISPLCLVSSDGVQLVAAYVGRDSLSCCLRSQGTLGGLGLSVGTLGGLGLSVGALGDLGLSVGALGWLGAVEAASRAGSGAVGGQGHGPGMDEKQPPQDSWQRCWEESLVLSAEKTVGI